MFPCFAAKKSFYFAPHFPRKTLPKIWPSSSKSCLWLCSLTEENPMLQTWKDDYLRWSPSDWGGIKAVKFSPHEIWKPDIMLYNTYVPGFLVLGFEHFHFFFNLRFWLQQGPMVGLLMPFGCRVILSRGFKSWVTRSNKLFIKSFFLSTIYNFYFELHAISFVSSHKTKTGSRMCLENLINIRLALSRQMSRHGYLHRN